MGSLILMLVILPSFAARHGWGVGKPSNYRNRLME